MGLKVHRASLTGGIGGGARELALAKFRLNRAACSRHKLDRTKFGTTGERYQVLTSAQFVWVPRRYQCERCRVDWAEHAWTGIGAMLTEATPEMQIIVETFVLAIYRVGQAEHEHRCWIEQEVKRVHTEGFGSGEHDRTVCVCGRFSWLDTRCELNTLRIARSGRVYLKGQRPKKKVTERPANLTQKQMAAIVHRMQQAASRAP